MLLRPPSPAAGPPARARSWRGLAWRLVLLLPLAAQLPALAGGGGGYSGGGGFSGGGGGFSGGGGGFSGGGFGGNRFDYGVTRFGGGGGSLALLLIVGVALGLVLVVAWAASRERRRQLVQRAHRAHGRDQSGQLAGCLRGEDPDFDLAAFERRVREAFSKAQAAWSAQDLTAVRPFVSDGIHARWRLQLDEQRRLDLRDQVDRLRIDRVELVDLQRGDGFEALSVFIGGSAVDQKLRRSDGSRLAGLATPQPFAEYWSFLRRSGTRSLRQRLGLIEGRCPSCGAGVLHNQHARCAHCGIVLRSGAHDWVLTEITQPSEWAGLDAGRISGIEAFRAQDPAFSPQALEDRASVLFYRWRAAEAWDDPDRLLGFVSDDCRAWVAGGLGEQRDRQGRRHWVGEAAVGAVRTEALRHGAQRDRALVEVRWSGIRCQQTPGGEVERGLSTPPRRHYLLLERPAAADSRVDAALSGAHCPHCGAPDDDLVAGDCRACGQPLAAGGDWQLAAIHAWSDPAVAELKRSIGLARPSAAAVLAGAVDRRPDGSALLAWVTAMALADGRLEQAEQLVLAQVAAQCGVPPAQLPAFVAEARDRAHSELPQPQGLAEARAWFEQLIALAARDGVVDAAERRMLQRLGRHAAYEPAEVRRRIRAAERQELAAARAG